MREKLSQFSPVDLTYCVENPWMIALRTVVVILPAWFRCTQCLRRFYDSKDNVHIYNACKYFSSFFVPIFSSITFATTGNWKRRKIIVESKLIFHVFHFPSISGKYDKSTDNPFFYMWICASIISSCYAYLWVFAMHNNYFHIATCLSVGWLILLKNSCKSFRQYAIWKTIFIKAIWAFT